MKICDRTIKIIKKEEEKCIGCNICMKGCPMLDKFCNSPKNLLKELLDNERFEYTLPYSCMLCGYCTKVCPKEVDLKSLFLDMRRDVVKENNGKLPKELNISGVELHQKLSFSKLFTSDIQNLQSDTIFFPGCGLLSYSPKIVENTYEYLRSKIDGIGIYTKCCGKPTAFMGKDEKFREYYSILEREFKDKNVKRIITGCQNCFMTIGNNSKDIEVISLWEVLANVGIPDDRKGIGKTIELEFTIHDPCPTRDIDIIHSSIRNIVDDLGFKTEEMKYKKGRTLCCGSGGMVSVTQSKIAKSHTRRRAQEAKTEYIITYCQECVESMRRGGKKSYHILDLLFNEDFQHMEQKNQRLVIKWVNRYRGKNMGK
ncbi:(Fe-S)-binding protein [Tissierella praeacuta]|uniref:(Fe-S)-binding protein n=1 Tax=Tissierella praeacuta TaxID=43131 RepID=UPI0028ABD937|nr:(Fe-S)-binding protein [Tissierella praeacuta]